MSVVTSSSVLNVVSLESWFVPLSKNVPLVRIGKQFIHLLVLTLLF